MIDKREIIRLLKAGETYRVERTRSISNTDKICQAICAFANDLPNSGRPGYLLLGVQDDGALSGLNVTESLLNDIVALRSDGNILPLPTMVVEPFSFPEGDVLVVEVQPSFFPPVRYRGRIWIRIGSRKDIASESEERILIERRTMGVSSFDTTPCLEATRRDMDADLFSRTYLKQAIPEEIVAQDSRPVEEQMASLRLFNMDRLCPTFSGLLLLGLKTEYFLPGAYVQYVRFAGLNNGSEIRNELKFSGNILQLVPKLDDFLEMGVIERHPVPVSVLREKTVFNYPKWAIRELLMNALMHRDYQSNMPVRFYQYPDRIEITNPGGLYGNVRPENFPNASDYRNPTIAEAMRTMKFVNKFNRGIARVQVELKENGNGEAIFDYNKITVFGVSIPSSLVAGQDDYLRDRQESHLKKEQVREQVREQVVSLLKAMDGESSAAELMKLMLLHGRRHFVYYYLRPAMRSGLVEMTIPEKPNSRLQKYRLTLKGKELINGMRLARQTYENHCD
jgi:ATP-dependent DNA helicase RecG